MKKTIIAIAMLFSVAIYGQNNITGIWQEDSYEDDYYTVILKNDKKGYIFTNFSFGAQNIVIENFVEENDNYVKSIVHNPDNGWRVYVTYEYINDNNLFVTYEGDYNGSVYFTRKEIN